MGTDSSYSEAIEELMPVIEHIGKLAVYYESQGTPELAPVFKPLKGIGYVPPPLVGVWATAPYFHNGSVPHNRSGAELQNEAGYLESR